MKQKFYNEQIWLRQFIVAIAAFFIFQSCNNATQTTNQQQTIKNGSSFSIISFDALTNYKGDSLSAGNVKHIYLDYSHAIDSGFVLPSATQTENGLFEFSFKIKNTGNETQPCYYKIYYQNESYKFHEIDSATQKPNPLAIENFYGSYNDSSIAFKKTKSLQPGEEITITDFLSIEGNPRCEPQFYRNGKNQQWMRNPRVGSYSFTLVTADEKTITEKKIPAAVQNICITENGSYINPYYWYFFAEGKKNNSISVKTAETILKAASSIDFSKGIFADASRYPELDKNQLPDCDCGISDSLYKHAQIAQFMHSVSKQNMYENIPVIMDVINDNYTKRDYNWNAAFIRREELIKTITTVAKQPCKTVGIDKVQNKAIIKNPASTPGNWKKESVGIVTRNGLTYGKWRVKAKLTQLLSKDNVWNGLTNAIWLIVQPDSGDWNRRRICNGEGYMRDYGSGRGDPRANVISYSEIDFEILKTAPYCPDMVFPPAYKNHVPNKYDEKSWNVELPDDMKKIDSDIIVACTNWDMACPDVKRFGVGCNSIDWNGRTFYTHRWDNWYNALTEKSPHNDDELFGSDYYWFEIEWTPREIIWRIGPEKNQLRVVGYMNDEITSVPNNQMLMVITQEWHNSRWWPGSPYQQENIPFPANDIKGEILKIEVE